MKNNPSNDDIRRRIAQRLGSPITAPEWSHLEEEGLLEGIRNAVREKEGPAAIGEYIQDAANYLQRVRESQRGAAPQRGPRMRSPVVLQAVARLEAVHATQRDEYLSDALAGLAEQDEEVQAFRRDHFGGRYIYDYYTPPNTLPYPAWIEQQWARERLPAELSAGQLLVLTYAELLSTKSAGEDEAEGADEADSENTEASVIRSLPVVPGGTLDRLRRIAERLSHQYRWDPAGAATFILTGFAPFVSTLTAQIDWRSDLSVMTRIVLTVDLVMTPKQVAEAYRRERKKLVTTFPREMDQKSLLLAAVTQSKSFAGHTRADQMKVWNIIAGEDWQYSDVHKFGRDLRRAVHRLLHPHYRRPSDNMNGET